MSGGRARRSPYLCVGRIREPRILASARRAPGGLVGAACAGIDQDRPDTDRSVSQSAILLRSRPSDAPRASSSASIRSQPA